MPHRVCVLAPLMADTPKIEQLLNSVFSWKEKTKDSFDSTFYFNLRKMIKFKVQKYKRLSDKFRIITFLSDGDAHT